jgi:predicted DNA-binding transcriptional regulator AlpA
MEARNSSTLPETGYVRLSQIIPSIIPVSKSTWWNGVKDGRYPRPVKLSERCTAWRVEDIRNLIERLAA